ncbi:MAG: hypothetical protein M3070_09505 [Actinomycetota bacterium]|nr:hypothetical protein [Actinomycetota bacterium]
MKVRAVFGPVAVLALVAGCSSSGAGYGGGGGTSASSTSSTPKAAAVSISVKGGSLVGAGGRSLYVNSADTTSHVICTGTCLKEWPPVAGKPSAGAGVDAAKLGSFTRLDGAVQATYGGHPLYEFAKDSAPGDAKGDGVTDEGGTWGLAGATAGRSSPAPSSSGGGYGGGGY